MTWEIDSSLFHGIMKILSRPLMGPVNNRDSTHQEPVWAGSSLTPSSPKAILSPPSLSLSKQAKLAVCSPRSRKIWLPEDILVCTKGYLKYMNGKNDSEKIRANPSQILTTPFLRFREKLYWLFFLPENQKFLFSDNLIWEISY